MHHLLLAFGAPGSPARLGSHAPRYAALGEPLRAPGGLGGYKAASGIGAYPRVGPGASRTSTSLS